MKQLLSIWLLFVIYLGHCQNRDTVWHKNGTLYAGELISPIFGKSPHQTLRIRIGKKVQKFKIEEVTNIKLGPINFKPVWFKVGKEEFYALANQYYFGEINLFYAKVEPFGTIHLIENNGIVQLLTLENLSQTLIGAFGNCYPDNIPATLNDIKSSDLISFADAYHNCAGLKGRSEHRKGISKTSFALRMGIDFGIRSSVNFRSRQHHLLLNSDDLVSNYAFRNAIWNTEVRPVFSSGLYYKLPNLKFEIGTVLRYLDYRISNDNYHLAPFDDTADFVEIEFGFKKIELGLSVLFVPSQEDYIPYLRFTTFGSVNYRFKFSEQDLSSNRNGNSALTVTDKKGRSYAIAIGTRKKNLSVELGLNVYQGALEVTGPTYRLNNFSRSLVSGYDSGGYEVSQIHLTALYDFQLGNPRQKFFMHR